jgi:MFS family permease
MNYFQFFKANPKILLFAIILTFYSGFGQTFLLSLYIPDIIADFQISQSLFSTIYASATLASGFTIIFAGKIIDRMNLMRFAMIVVAGFILAHLMAGLSVSLIMVFISLFMLRFFGQGLLTHTSMTAMGRYFSYSRGKALSIAYLGFPLAEAIFPISIVSLIAILGWRESFLISGLFISLSLIPIVWFLLKNFTPGKIREQRSQKEDQTNEAQKPDKTWRQKEIIRDLNFYIYAPTVFIVGFTLTSLFFFQTFIADFKGWSVEWMALSITAYAIGSFGFSIITGPLIDRFTARKLFPFILLPMALGLMVLSVFNHPVAAVIFWLLTGISAGANPTTGNSLYAETYGVKSLGSIRSIFTFVMVSSTAAGPVVYSNLLNLGINYNQVHYMVTAIILANMLFIMWGFRKQKREIVS